MAPSLSLPIFFHAFLLLCLQVAAEPSAAALAACANISASVHNTHALPSALLSPSYLEAKNHYWSAANADLTPACVVEPSSAEDVSKIVKILLEFPDVGFAMKSGGHNPNVNWSSTDGGVLISFRPNLQSTTYQPESQTALVGPGARWSEAVEALEPFNRTLIGGRLGDVGVGGYTLGGGLSFLSAEYGLACDNLANVELVLANGDIVNANASSNPDLFFALKGGGNQFGIVTTFTFNTVPTGTVWGGTRVYSASKSEALLNAVQAFTANKSDSKAAIIITGEILIESLVEIFVCFFYYNGPEPPPGVFDQFDAIKHDSSSTKSTTYADLLNANDRFNIYGMRYLIRGTTLPNLPSPDGENLLNHHYNTWKSYVMRVGIPFPGFIFSIAFQPYPQSIAQASLDRGGNALALDPRTGDHIFMEYDISWQLGVNDDTAHSFAMAITDEIDRYAMDTYGGAARTNSVGPSQEEDSFTPLFMNDAMYDMRPLQSYKNGSYERLLQAKRKYDPEGFFTERTGGFKFTGA